MPEGYSMSDEIVPTKCLNWDYITDTSSFFFFEVFDCMPETVCIAVEANNMLWNALEFCQRLQWRM